MHIAPHLMPPATLTSRMTTFVIATFSATGNGVPTFTAVFDAEPVGTRANDDERVCREDVASLALALLRFLATARNRATRGLCRSRFPEIPRISLLPSGFVLRHLGVLHPDSLAVHEFVDPHLAELASVAGVTDPAER